MNGWYEWHGMLGYLLHAYYVHRSSDQGKACMHGTSEGSGPPWGVLPYQSRHVAEVSMRPMATVVPWQPRLVLERVGPGMVVGGAWICMGCHLPHHHHCPSRPSLCQASSGHHHYHRHRPPYCSLCLGLCGEVRPHHHRHRFRCLHLGSISWHSSGLVLARDSSCQGWARRCWQSQHGQYSPCCMHSSYSWCTRCRIGCWHMAQGRIRSSQA